MANESRMAREILDTALSLGEQYSWEAVRLHEVAAALDISLRQISEHYRQKDDLAEAWFDRADRAMLEDAARDDYLQLPLRDRLHRSIMSWLNVLSEHKRITAQMLRYKFEVGHIHLQALGIMRISRTVQWILEAAQCNKVENGRILEEIVLSTMYLSTFAYWLRDNSRDSASTSKFLDTSLSRAESLGLFTSTFRPISAQRSENIKSHESKDEASVNST